jgi:hypothetical protein
LIWLISHLASDFFHRSWRSWNFSQPITLLRRSAITAINWATAFWADNRIGRHTLVARGANAIGAFVRLGDHFIVSLIFRHIMSYACWLGSLTTGTVLAFTGNIPMSTWTSPQTFNSSSHFVDSFF